MDDVYDNIHRFINMDDVFVYRNDEYYKDSGMANDTRVKKIYGVNDLYTDFRIGDKVRILKTGGFYSSYSAMAGAMGLVHWNKGDWSLDYQELINCIGKIESLKIHESRNSIVAGVTLIMAPFKIGSQILIDDNCLEFVEHNDFITDEDIEI